MPHFVYILQSLKDNRYYIGETENVDRRLEFHNAGLQRATKHRLPFKLIKVEQFTSRSEALKREKEIKSWKGGLKFKSFLIEM